MKANSIKLAMVVSSPMTVNAFLTHQVLMLSARYQLTIFVNLESEISSLEVPPNVNVVHVPIQRNIHLLLDFWALCKLVRLFWQGGYSLVHSVTPKAGLLAMIAATLTKVPHRLHTFTGQVWVTRKGVSRFVIKQFDRIIAGFATVVLVDSPSQRDFLVREQVVGESTALSLCDGSISGVDIARFVPSSVSRQEIRSKLKFSDDDVVLLFLGRLKRDKGVIDLVDAFLKTLTSLGRLRLVLVGPDEEQLLGSLTKKMGAKAEYVRFEPFTRHPEQYMCASDVFVLPSYREGFGNVVIEAAACGVPAIASRIYGLTDAVAEHETGLLVDPAAVDGLSEAILTMAESESLRKTMGVHARERAILLFSQERLSNALLELYSMLLK